MSKLTNPHRKEEINHKISHFLSQPNARLYGASFDANHLSSFISNSPYSHITFSNKPNQSSNNSRIVSAINASNPSNLSNIKPSYFFVGMKNPHQSDFPSNYSNLSPLVLPDFADKGKIVELRKLEGPRGQRIIKNAFKSGILSVDNPLNESSRVYKDQHEVFLKRQDYLTVSKERQAKMIAKYSVTNQNIEFFNKNSRSPIEKAPPIIEKITPYWTRKGHTNENFVNKWSDTHIRVFSVEPEKYSLERARFLREKDVGPKEYNLISETSNKLDIKHREIIKVLG